MHTFLGGILYGKMKPKNINGLWDLILCKVHPTCLLCTLRFQTYSPVGVVEYGKSKSEHINGLGFDPL